MKNLKFIFILLIILNVIVTILGSAYLSIEQQAEFYRIVIHINVGIECFNFIENFQTLKRKRITYLFVLDGYKTEKK